VQSTISLKKRHKKHPEHPQIADSLSLLGHIAYSLGKYAEATLFSQRAFTLYEKIYGPGLDPILEGMDVCDRHLGRRSSCPSFFFSTLSVEEPTFQVEGDVTYVYLFLCQNTFLVEVVGIATTGYSWRYPLFYKERGSYRGMLGL
jgi:hypothetical protein